MGGLGEVVREYGEENEHFEGGEEGGEEGVGQIGDEVAVVLDQVDQRA